MSGWSYDVSMRKISPADNTSELILNVLVIFQNFMQFIIEAH